VQLIVYSTRAYYLRNVVVYYPSDKLPTFFKYIEYSIFIDGVAVMFSLLSDKQKYLVDYVSPISELIVGNISQILTLFVCGLTIPLFYIITV
jgi:hypothetical protein